MVTPSQHSNDVFVRTPYSPPVAIARRCRPGHGCGCANQSNQAIRLRSEGPDRQQYWEQDRGAFGQHVDQCKVYRYRVSCWSFNEVATVLEGHCRHNEFPVLIAYATQVAEVTPLVHCAQANGIRAMPRSGGHQ